ncbi:Cysteine and histidine-rich domain-containing protein 1 [Smittium mucronatum]|uniref:Cysteine and histidine-rich domain-containing protein 1 n=1 Tax=Smittium mucronatum TaxID=133383 RepID=A0A1R0GM29_9FUNG|nr:Cysteine and histidine-rich domain-containing protein 1 [Smittium mucronatum]OLY79762.1 Cysteine and histidine-rich domain-containing protein 1 [Smittium mucronatum]
MTVCVHNGCNKEYDESLNKSDSCQYHPGTPVFHEGYKSWSCCKKRKLTFEDFMKEPGCTFGFHDDNPKPDASPVTKGSADSSNEQKSIDLSTLSLSSQPFKEKAVSENFISSASDPNVTPNKIDLSQKNNGGSIENKVVIPTAPEEDPDDAVIEAGAKCRRNGCSSTFKNYEVSKDPKSPESVCNFHPGNPLFHEGSKGWSCCKRRVLEFDEFLKIKGCAQGKHLFSKPQEKNVQVFCKNDFYQTQTSVIVSIFAKNVVKDKSTVELCPGSINVKLVMKDSKYYSDTIPLFSKINIEESSFKILSTKIEFVLKKDDNISWPSLTPTDKITSWTTFGKGDSPLPEVKRS